MRKALLDNLLNEQSNVAVESPSKGEVLSLLSEAAFTNAEVAYMGVEDSQFDIERLVDIAAGLESINESLPVNEIDDVVLAGVNAVVGEVGLEAKGVVEDIKETIRRVWRAIIGAIRKGVRQVKIWLKVLFDGTEKFKQHVDMLSGKITTLAKIPKDKKDITAPLVSGALDIDGEISPVLIKDRLSLVTPLFSKQMVANVEAITAMVEGMAGVDVTNIKEDSVSTDSYRVKKKVSQVLGGIVLSKKDLPIKDRIMNNLFPTTPIVSDLFEFADSARQIHSTETLPGNKAFYVLSSRFMGKHEKIKVDSGALNFLGRLGSLSLINPGIKFKENKLPVLTIAEMTDLCNFVSSKLDDVIYFNDYYTKRSLKSSEKMFDAVDKLSKDIYDKIDDEDNAITAQDVFRHISGISREVYGLSGAVTLDVVRYTVKTCRSIIKYVELSSTRYEDDLDESTLLESK